MTDQPAPTPESTPEGQPQDQDQTFTQADVDRIVKERVQRVQAKYSDYDDLKKKAEGAKTLEDRIAEIEQRATSADARALRAEIANAHGLSAEDRDLFLTGTDEETLTAQAKRLADRESERKQQGNRVPTEGRTPNPSKPNPLRDIARQMFSENS